MAVSSKDNAGLPLDLTLDVNAGRFFVNVPPLAHQALASIKGRRRAGLHMTITLFNSPGGDGLIQPATAKISWGTGGAKIADVFADFLQGTLLSLCASDVEIVGINDGDALANLGCTIGYLPYPGETKAQRTVEFAAVAAGGGVSPLMSIPRFAFRTDAHFVPSLPVTFNTQVVDFIAGDGVTVVSSFIADPLGMGEHHFPNTARFVRWTNTSANVRAPVMVFRLAM